MYVLIHYSVFTQYENKLAKLNMHVQFLLV